MKTPLQRAIAYATRVEHNGAGFTLMLMLSDGSRLEVKTTSDPDYPLITHPSEGEVFISDDHIVGVEVMW